METPTLQRLQRPGSFAKRINHNNKSPTTQAMSTLAHVSILSPNKFFRLGMEKLVEGWDGFVAGRVVNKRTSIHDLAFANLPDLIVVDLVPQNDWILEQVKHIHQAFPEMKFLGMVNAQQELRLRPFIQAGIRGFVFKEATELGLKQAVRQCLNSGYYCPTNISQILAEEMLRPMSQNLDAAETTLSDKELKALELICMGGTNSSVANSMAISPRTVEGYKISIRQKLQASTLINAVFKAIDSGLIQLKNNGYMPHNSAQNQA